MVLAVFLQPVNVLIVVGIVSGEPGQLGATVRLVVDMVIGLVRDHAVAVVARVWKKLPKIAVKENVRQIRPPRIKNDATDISKMLLAALSPAHARKGRVTVIGTVNVRSAIFVEEITVKVFQKICKVLKKQ